jgi:hypothetical protein
VDQIKSRFADLNGQLSHPMNSLLGVGLDGRYFVKRNHRGMSDVWYSRQIAKQDISK